MRARDDPGTWILLFVAALGAGLVIATTQVGSVVATVAFGALLFSAVSLIALVALCVPFYAIWHWGGAFVGSRLTGIHSPDARRGPERRKAPHVDRSTGRWVR